MKPSIPMLLSFLLPLTFAAQSRAEEPPPAEPDSAAPAPSQPAPVLGSAMLPTAPLPAAPPPLLERRSEGLRTAGLVLIPLGSVALAGGAFVATLGAFGGTVRDQDSTGPTPATRVALGFMGAGALTLTGGIIMAVVGSKKVPLRTTEALAPAPKWSVEPQVGLGSAGVKVRF
jgi:hypothetical protein